MRKKHRYDTQYVWVVFELRDKAGPLVHHFNNRQAGDEYVAGDKARRLGPAGVMRLPLEQAAPLLFAAGRATLDALTAFRGDPLAREGLYAAADFLQAAIDYARLEPNIADIYRETRRTVLAAADDDVEPGATILVTLREHVERYKNVS
jgi:hypothetical protein